MALIDLYRRYMFGQSPAGTSDVMMTEGTRGLLGTGGQMGGGLLNTFERPETTDIGKTISNINPFLLIGADIAGQGFRGRDPFGSVVPAVARTAQIQKLLRPKVGALKQAYDPKTDSVVFATDKQIVEQNLKPAVPTEKIVSTPGGGLSISKGYGGTGSLQKKDDIKLANELYTGTFELNNVANTMISNLEKAKVGGVGAGISALDSVGSQINQAAQAFGIAENFRDTGTGSIDKVLQDDFNLSKEAVNYEKVKSNAINLAYMMARIDEPGGRFTDRDIALKMQEIGIGQNPQKTIEVLKGAVELRNKNARFKYKTLTGQDMPGFDVVEEEKEKKLSTDPLNLGF
jgi:hypothetical protein